MTSSETFFLAIFLEVIKRDYLFKSSPSPTECISTRTKVTEELVRSRYSACLTDMAAQSFLDFQTAGFEDWWQQRTLGLLISQGRMASKHEVHLQVEVLSSLVQLG